MGFEPGMFEQNALILPLEPPRLHIPMRWSEIQKPEYRSLGLQQLQIILSEFLRKELKNTNLAPSRVWTQVECIFRQLLYHFGHQHCPWQEKVIYLF